jgi:hypothetical protein
MKGVKTNNGKRPHFGKVTPLVFYVGRVLTLFFDTRLYLCLHRTRMPAESCILHFELKECRENLLGKVDFFSEEPLEAPQLLRHWPFGTILVSHSLQMKDLLQVKNYRYK